MWICVCVCVLVADNVKLVMRNLFSNTFSKLFLIIVFKESLFKHNIIIKWKESKIKKTKIQIKNL